jgi:hypothetical protein
MSTVQTEAGTFDGLTEQEEKRIGHKFARESP